MSKHKTVVANAIHKLDVIALTKMFKEIPMWVR